MTNTPIQNSEDRKNQPKQAAQNESGSTGKHANDSSGREQRSGQNGEQVKPGQSHQQDKFGHKSDADKSKHASPADSGKSAPGKEGKRL